MANLKDHIVALFKPRDRSKQYDPILEVLPNIALILLLILLILMVVVILIIGIFATPAGNLELSSTFEATEAVYNGTEPIIHEVNGLSPANIQFLFNLKFELNKTFVGIGKNDLMLRVTLEGRNSASATWNSLTRDSVQKRGLTCSQNDIFYYTGVTLNNYVYECRSVVVFNERYVPYSNYRATVYLMNMQDIYERGFLSDKIVTFFQTNSSSYTIFEMVFRYIFCAMTLIIMLTYFITLLRAQWFVKWNTTQKWLLIMLFLMFWYHDPLFALQLTGFPLFAFLNVFFSLTFVFTFLFYLLIFFHILVTKQEERRFLFYLVKLALVVPPYILSIVLFAWSRFYNYTDSAYTSISDVPGYSYMEIALVVLVIFYIIGLMYYVFSAIAAYRRFTHSLSARFKVVGVFSFVVLICFSGVTIASEGFRYSSQGLTFFTSYFIIFLYFGSLGFLFLPSANVRVKKVPGEQAAGTPVEADSHDAQAEMSTQPPEAPKEKEDELQFKTEELTEEQFQHAPPPQPEEHEGENVTIKF